VRQKRQRDSQARRQGELPPPPPLSTYLGYSRPLRPPLNVWGSAFSVSPLLHSNLKHLSLQLFCFPSSLIWFSCFNSTSFSSSSSSCGSLSPRCPATAMRVHHHHGGTGEGEGPKKECVGELQAFALPSPLPTPPSLPCSSHPPAMQGALSRTQASLPGDPPPCSLRFSMCHRSAAYTLWHCSTPTEDNMALQRARLY